MVKNNQSIEIVRSARVGLGSMTNESCQAIFAVLAKHYAHVDITLVSDEADLAAVVARNPDLVFLGMKFVDGSAALGVEDPHKIWVAHYLEAHGIAHTGSSSEAHMLEFNKPLAKQRVLEADLKTSAFFVMKQHEPRHNRTMQLPFPVFIKPTNRGGGAGIDDNSVAYTAAEMRSKVRSIATKLHADSLVEHYLPGREFSVALLKDISSPGYFTMPIELVTEPSQRGIRLLSQHVKSSNIEHALVVTDVKLKAAVTMLALKAFHALGARDYGRIDIRLDEHGVPHFLEANLIPSLISGYGSFPKACMLNKGIKYEQMILKITKLGLLRSNDHGLEDIDMPELDGLLVAAAH